MAKRGVASIRTREYELLIATIKAARETAGIRHDELAAKLGRSRMYIYSIESFGRRVDPEEVRQIAVALDLPQGQLLQDWLSLVGKTEMS